jgi:3-isopropylmalate/(R)-2-methylmalate dehydratase large subunit
MRMTIIEKILARAGGLPRVSPGELVVVAIDTAVLLDSSFFFQILAGRRILSVADPKKIVVIFDHEVPAPTVGNARAQSFAREFVKRFGVERFHDIGRDHGISHVVVAERGYALPGSVLVCGDSHTCSAGAFNCAARGIGSPDMVYAVTTGETWFRVGTTVRYDFIGALSPGVSAKDVFLHIARLYGHHATQNVEFGGPGLAALSIDARRTLSTMGAELSAEFTTFEADERLVEYVRARNPAPFVPQFADDDAEYADRRTIDLGSVEPLVALPDAIIGNVRPLEEAAGVPIQQAFIGSCANGTLEDLASAAKVVAGRSVAAGVRLLVTPGSQAIYRQAIKAGYIEALMEAGAVVTNSTCGACPGSHMGVLGPGETCITASTRNFRGRMGDPTARIYMASSATVAASAIAGTIASPLPHLRETAA